MRVTVEAEPTREGVVIRIKAENGNAILAFRTDNDTAEGIAEGIEMAAHRSRLIKRHVEEPIGPTKVGEA